MSQDAATTEGAGRWRCWFGKHREVTVFRSHGSYYGRFEVRHCKRCKALRVVKIEPTTPALAAGVVSGSDR